MRDPWEHLRPIDVAEGRMFNPKEGGPPYQIFVRTVSPLKAVEETIVKHGAAPDGYKWKPMYSGNVLLVILEPL